MAKNLDKNLPAKKKKDTSKRPPAIKKEYYIAIDEEAWTKHHELIPVGDPIEMPVITKRVPSGDFEIVYMSNLFLVLKELGNQKIKVLEFILKNKDSSNMLNMTNKEIAEKVGCSRPTVIDTIKVLQNNKLITRKGTVYMLYPSFFVKGNRRKEAYLLQKFEEMVYEVGANMKPDETFSDYDLDLPEAQDVEVDPQLSFTDTGEIVQRAKEV